MNTRTRTRRAKAEMRNPYFRIWKLIPGTGEIILARKIWTEEELEDILPGISKDIFDIDYVDYYSKAHMVLWRDGEIRVISSPIHPEV